MRSSRTTTPARRSTRGLPRSCVRSLTAQCQPVGDPWRWASRPRSRAGAHPGWCAPPTGSRRSARRSRYGDEAVIEDRDRRAQLVVADGQRGRQTNDVAHRRPPGREWRRSRFCHRPVRPAWAPPRPGPLAQGQADLDLVENRRQLGYRLDQILRPLAAQDLSRLADPGGLLSRPQGRQFVLPRAEHARGLCDDRRRLSRSEGSPGAGCPVGARGSGPRPRRSRGRPRPRRCS